MAVFARSWEILLVSMAVAGGVHAVVDPATNLYLVRRINPGRLGLAVGIKQSAVPAATIVAGLAIPLLAVPLGWRWTFIVCGVLVLPTAAWSPILEPGPRRDVGQSRRAGDVPVRSLLLLSIGIGAASAGAVTLVGFSVDSAVHFGLSPAAAGLLAALGGALGLSVRIQSGRWADRRPGQYLDVVAIMLGLGTLVFLALATGSPPLVALATPLGYPTAWG